jgi:hypothetical protein
MWSTAGDGGVDKDAQALLAFTQFCANGDLTPSVTRCIGGQARFYPQECGERRRRMVDAADRRYGSSQTGFYSCSPQGATVRSKYLLGYQVSTVAAAGTEILVLSFREKLQQFVHDPDKVALRADAANAFKSMSRADILERACEHAPPAVRFFHTIYSGHPYVVAGMILLLSHQGTQQGDPLGMLLFPLALQTLALHVQSESDLELNLWYADDGTLVRSIGEVA